MPDFINKPLREWLTAEVLRHPGVALILREIIQDATDKDFEEESGVTKDEARTILNQWELCFMGKWGAPELARIIVLSDAGRNESLALRAISLAQGANKLTEVFKPADGIKWAKANGYLITSNIHTWCNVKPGGYKSPKSATSTVDAAASSVQNLISNELDTNNMVYWRIVLYSNIKKIDEHKKASCREVIQYLRKLNDPRIPDKGNVDELLWIDDYRAQQSTSKKTVSNAISDARKQLSKL